MLAKPLSKSALQSGNQCPRMLWFRHNMSYRSAQRRPDADTTMFEIGNIVGGIAQEFFDDGKTVVINTDAGFSPEHYADYAQQTADAMADPKVTCIAEATLYTGDLVVFIDLFHRNEDGSWDIYEVKSSKLAKPVHAQDCAWQTYVARTICGIDVRNSYIMIPNRGWSLIAQELKPRDYYVEYEPDIDLQTIEGVVAELGLDTIETSISQALANRYSALPHPYAVWANRFDLFAYEIDPLVGLFCERYATSYDIEDAAEYAASATNTDEYFLPVDDYTEWIYEQSIGDEIPAKISYMIDMVQQERPPLCKCARPGFGFECLQPYECDFKDVCTEFFEQGE